MRSDNEKIQKIKNRIAVMYCDMDFSVLNNASPSPSCIVNDYIGIGERSIELLFERLFNRNAPHKTIKIPFKYVEGETLFKNN